MEFVRYETEGKIGIITIDRPKALNALNSTVLEEIDQALDQAAGQLPFDEVRVLILTGAGEKAFVAGADIAQMKGFSKADGEAFGKRGNEIFRRIETFPIPVIAAVNGFALGGGCELALSCDIRICSENAVFAQPETGLGITPGFGGTQRLARTISVGYAKQMIYGGRNVHAEEAYRIGLVNKVCPSDQLMAEAKKLAGQICANAPIAVRNSKKAINEGLQVDIDQGIEKEEHLFGDCFETQDQQEGMGAFLEKRNEKTFINR